MNKICSYSVVKNFSTQCIEIENWGHVSDILNSRFSKVFYIIDSVLENEFKNFKEIKMFLDGGEDVKSFQSLEYILEKLHDAKLDRQSVLVAIGGGSEIGRAHV